MTESTRGIIYRILTVVFFGLVVFGVVNQELADQAVVVVTGLLGLGSNGLAWRNTSVARKRDNNP